MKPGGIFLILGVILSTFFLIGGEVKGEQSALKSFDGLIIYLDEKIIEVKRGKREVTFYRDVKQPVEKKEALEKPAEPKDKINHSGASSALG